MPGAKGLSPHELAHEWVKFENKYMRHDIGKAIDEA